MTGKRPLKPPRHLKAATKRWWASVVENYELEAHHVLALTAAAETWDRKEAARAALAKDGAFYTDRFGVPKSHPAAAVERDANILFVRILRELRLDSTEGPESRPPALGDR